jgi:4-amino-4-deoxy-L-arabinose transferase-like glycosyltransferase
VAERQASFKEPLILVVAALAMFLAGGWGLPLIRGEGMYALIPQEMFQAGGWLTPTLNGVPYLDKPPLLYWLNLGSYHILGLSVAAARLPTVLMTAGEVWFTWRIGRLLLGTRPAFLGCLVLLTSIGFFILHLQLLTDHPVTLAILAAFYFLLRHEESPARRWVAGFHLALAAGFLSKGFIGQVFPVLIGGLYALKPGRRHLFRLLLSPWGLALQLAVIAPWFAAMEWAHPGFLRHQIINEQIMRFLGMRQPPDIIPFSLPGFWLFLGIWLMPWTLLLPSALIRFWREEAFWPSSTGPARLLIIWAAAIMGFYTLSSSRIEYYSLPVLPPLALMVGWRLDRYLETPKDRSVPLALLVVGVLGLVVLFLLPYLEEICAANRREFVGMFALLAPMARWVTVGAPLLALAAAGVGLRFPRLAVAGYAALALFLIFCTHQTYLALSPLLSDKLPGDFIRTHAGPQDLVVMESIEEFEYGASLAYYANRRLLMVTRDGLPQFPYAVPPSQNYLITPRQLHALWRGPHRVFLLVDEATPADPFFAGASVALATPGKRLLVNRR